MLEAIAGFGQVLSRENDPLAILVQMIPQPQDEDKKVHLIQLDLSDKPNGPQLTPLPIKIDSDICTRYRWIGNMKGSSPQIYLTTNRLDYLTGQSIFNLIVNLEKAGLSRSSLYKDLFWILGSFYRCLPNNKPVLDIEKLGFVEKGFIEESWNKNKNKERSVAADISTALSKTILADLGLKAPQAQLWSLAYYGRPLAINQTYDQAVLFNKEPDYLEVDPQTKENHAIYTVCSICGATGSPITSSFSTLTFLKYYINDKLGFASNLHDFSSNFTACRKCYRGLLLAEKFLRQQMSFRVDPLRFMVLPTFVVETTLESIDLKTWADLLKDRVKGLIDTTAWLRNIAGTGGLETELADHLDELPEENLALLNFLFYRYQEGRSEFRIHTLVRDVAPSWISHLVKEAHQLSHRASELLGEGRWHLDLTALSRLIPLRKGQSEEYKKLLHIYQALLSRRPLLYNALIREFSNLAKIYLTGDFKSTNVLQPRQGYEELELASRLMQANLFLAFLRKEKLLKGGSLMKTSAQKSDGLDYLREGMKLYLHEMSYREPQTALFLLGYLLHQIGSSQKRSGYKHKPILGKINYNGMSWPKVVRLSNLLVDHLNQHRIFMYNESLYGAMKKMFDAHVSNWPLSSEENVFFMLSGYAWATRAAYRAGIEKRAKQAAKASKNES